MKNDAWDGGQRPEIEKPVWNPFRMIGGGLNWSRKEKQKSSV